VTTSQVDVQAVEGFVGGSSGGSKEAPPMWSG
jgi:hypothetical protein